MLLGHVRDLVAEDRAQLILIFSNLKYPGKHTDFSAGHCKRVNRFIVENFDFPIHTRVGLIQLRDYRLRD